MLRSEIPDEMTIDFPEIVIDSNRVDRIVLREPTGQQVQKAETELKGGVNVASMRMYQISLVSQCSGVPRQVIERLPISKLNEASRYAQSFIDAGPATGAT